MPTRTLSRTPLRGVGMSGSSAACTCIAVMQQDKKVRMRVFMALSPYSLAWNQRCCLVHLDSDDEPASLECLVGVHPLGIPVKASASVRLNANRGEVVM